MVKERLLQPDAQEKGWLLDGYPRSYSQAMALETLNIRPDIFILLDVSSRRPNHQIAGI
jgi:adenylate kinase